MDGARRLLWLAFALVALVLLGATGYLTYLAATGSDLAEIGKVPGPVRDFAIDVRDALPWAIAALAASLAALGLWARDRRRAELADEAIGDRGQAEAERDRAQAVLAQARADLRDREERLEKAEDQIRVIEEARRKEREWIAQLREELRGYATTQGLLGGTDEVPVLVLRMAIKLVGAERGILISKNAGGRGRVVAWEGFDNDPTESALAERFAEEVIEEGAIVRERARELGEVPEEDATPADREIENLIAIPIYISDDFTGAVICANSEDIESHDEQVLLALGNQAGAILDNAELRGELRETYIATVQMLAEAIRAKDPHLGGHSHEVSAYVGRVAERLGLEPKRREELVFASLLHDVGKIGVSERILLKPGKLTSEEYTVIKLHPRIGARLVQQVPALAVLGQFILHHHERFDGTGYPTGLSGEEIPPEARVIGIVDAFSAMTSDRPYRGRLSLDDACAELEACGGTQFDPEIVRLFVEEVRKDPPTGEGENMVYEALADPELESVRSDDGLIVGSGPLELTDHLTLLYTHRYFHETVAAEAERAGLQDGTFAIALFELAEIERINRDHNYGTGDAAIKRVAHAVEEAAVRCGGTACRYGGRRLALIAPGADDDGIEAAASSVVHGAGEITVRASCAVWAPGETGEAVIARAVLGLRAPLSE